MNLSVQDANFLILDSKWAIFGREKSIFGWNVWFFIEITQKLSNIIYFRFKILGFWFSKDQNLPFRPQNLRFLFEISDFGSKCYISDLNSIFSRLTNAKFWCVLSWETRLISSIFDENIQKRRLFTLVINAGYDTLVFIMEQFQGQIYRLVVWGTVCVLFILSFVA